MRVLKNPVAQFLAAGVVIVIAVALVSDVLSRRAAEQEAIADARATTELLAKIVAEPVVPPGLEYGTRASARWFSDAVGDRLDVDNVERVVIWNAAGQVVWSDRKNLIGERFTLSHSAREVLATGRSEGELADLREPDNHFEVADSGLLEVYTRIDAENEPLLFEVYYAADDLERTTATVLDAFRPITVGGALAIGLLTIPLLVGLNRRLRRSSDAREKLLRAAVDASEEERRRIARDLHEGVGHRLREVADSIAREAVDEATPPGTAQRLRAADDELRASAESLRSLLLDIYPPDLCAARLEAALDDLVAPASQAGFDVKLEVDDLGSPSDDAVALVWRVAREGVRNAVRHARGSAHAVSLPRDRNARALRLADNRVGFVPGAFDRADRFGLRGLEDLASEAGGSLSVTSGPGRGTVLTLQVPSA